MVGQRGGDETGLGGEQIEAWNPVTSPALPLVRDEEDAIPSGINYYEGSGTSE